MKTRRIILGLAWSNKLMEAVQEPEVKIFKTIDGGAHSPGGVIVRLPPGCPG